MGLPVTARTDSAAPPRVSPSSLVRMTPVDAQCLVKALGHIDGILTGHRIDHQQNLLGLYRFLDAPQLVHQLFVDVKTSGGIQNQDVIAVVPGMQDRLAGDLHRVPLPHLKHRHAGLFAHDLQLLDRGRTINITGYQQRTLAALL